MPLLIKTLYRMCCLWPTICDNNSPNEYGPYFVFIQGVPKKLPT